MEVNITNPWKWLNYQGKEYRYVATIIIIIIIVVNIILLLLLSYNKVSYFLKIKTSTKAQD